MTLRLYPTAFRCLLLAPIVASAEPGPYKRGSPLTVEEVDAGTNKPTGRRCYTVARDVRQNDNGGLWLELAKATRRKPRKPSR